MIENTEKHPDYPRAFVQRLQSQRLIRSPVVWNFSTHRMSPRKIRTDLPGHLGLDHIGPVQSFQGF